MGQGGTATQEKLRRLLSRLAAAPLRGHYELLGVHLALRADSPWLARVARERLPIGANRVRASLDQAERVYTMRSPAPCPLKVLAHQFLVFADGVLIGRAETVEGVLDALESDSRQHVALTTNRRFFVHAAVVAWGGRAVVLPGPSGAGKTTMAAALGKLGATYYSDEFAVLDRHGRVEPFAAPLSFKSGGRRATRHQRPEALGLTVGTETIDIMAILFFSYRKGARWRPTRLTDGEGALRLATHSLSLLRRPRATLRVVHAAVLGAASFSIVRGEATLAARRVQQLVEGL